jgi:3-phosphoglycerate kinase
VAELPNCRGGTEAIARALATLSSQPGKAAVTTIICGGDTVAAVDGLLGIDGEPLTFTHVSSGGGVIC